MRFSDLNLPECKDFIPRLAGINSLKAPIIEVAFASSLARYPIASAIAFGEFIARSMACAVMPK